MKESRLLTTIALFVLPLLGLAQENRKSQTHPNPKNVQTEKEKAHAVQSLSLPTMLPAQLSGARRALQLSPEADAWTVQIVSRGGLTGSGRGDLIVTSQGSLTWSAAEDSCNDKLPGEALGLLSQVVKTADTSNWGGTTVSTCQDCYVTAVVLQRREPDGAERVYIAYWDDATQGTISEGARKVYDTFMAQRTCKR